MEKLNLYRQLNDVILQARQLKDPWKSSYDFEAYSSFVIEIKSYLANNSTNPMIIERLDKIPEIQYNRTNIKLWQFLLVPALLVYIIQEFIARNRCIRQAEEAASVFSSIEYLLRHE